VVYQTGQHAAPDATYVQPAPVPPRKTSRTTVIVVCAVLVLLGIAILVVFPRLKDGSYIPQGGIVASPSAVAPAVGCEHGTLGNGACAGAAGDSAEAKFVAAARAYTTDPSVTDEQLLELGRSMCSALDRTAGDVASLVDVDTTVPKKTILETARDASNYLCPQWVAKVNAYKLPTGIEDGSWLADIDFPAGTYEVTTKSEDCYWDVTTEKADGEKNYVKQELGPGHYRVNLKRGQTFTTKECGFWTKV
jgi:hypothetical protein